MLIHRNRLKSDCMFVVPVYAPASYRSLDSKYKFPGLFRLLRNMHSTDVVGFGDFDTQGGLLVGEKTSHRRPIF